MKKIFSLLLFATLLVGCSNETATNDKDPEGNKSSAVESSVQKESTEESSSVQKEAITELNKAGDITYNGETMYSITATEVVDVTDEAKNDLINDTNYLDYASNGQGKQAVKITLLMKNKSGEVIGMPYLDDIKVIDSSGITNIGGWKDESGMKTDFGSYVLDDELNAKKDLYEVQNDETRIATSTVVLATESEKISFKFVSQKYGDYIEFELPVK